MSDPLSVRSFLFLSGHQVIEPEDFAADGNFQSFLRIRCHRRRFVDIPNPDVDFRADDWHVELDIGSRVGGVGFQLLDRLVFSPEFR